MKEQLNEWVPALQGLNLGSTNKAILGRTFHVGPHSERIEVSKDMARARLDNDLIIWVNANNEELAVTYHGRIEYFRTSKITGGKAAGFQGIYDSSAKAYVITIDPHQQHRMDVRTVFSKPEKVEYSAPKIHGSFTKDPGHISSLDIEVKRKTWTDWVEMKKAEMNRDAILIRRKALERINQIADTPSYFSTSSWKEALSSFPQFMQYVDMINHLKQFNSLEDKDKPAAFQGLIQRYQQYKANKG